MKGKCHPQKGAAEEQPTRTKPTTIASGEKTCRRGRRVFSGQRFGKEEKNNGE